MVLARCKGCGICAKNKMVRHLHFDVTAFFSISLHGHPQAGVDTCLCRGPIGSVIAVEDNRGVLGWQDWIFEAREFALLVYFRFAARDISMPYPVSSDFDDPVPSWDIINAALKPFA